MESFKFVQDIEVVEMPLEKGDIYERYVYSSEKLYPVDSFLPFGGEVTLERYRIKTFCRSFQDPKTKKVTTEEYKFAVANSVWEKLGMIPNYIEAIEEDYKLSTESEKHWWDSAIKAQKKANKYQRYWHEAEDEYRKYLYAPLWQRIKYLFKGYL